MHCSRMHISQQVHRMPQVRFDKELIRKYDRPAPRYTSYPTAVHFHTGFDARKYEAVARALRSTRHARPLSLYVHIPFCTSPCFYCACTRIITRRREDSDEYLRYLYREIELQGALFGSERPVEQLHFGGGTPTFLTLKELEHLLQRLAAHFQLCSRDEREYSIEIDPRTVNPDTVRGLAALGFNRLSLGVQDFDPAVQQAINRVQSSGQTLELIGHARAAGFGSVSVDLIYGLPRQTPASFERTLQQVLTARPDRLSVYAYAHLPHMFKAQRRLPAAELPDAEGRLELLELTIATLTAAGYVYVGMDHFALPDDELVHALQQGSLQRNFQGYSTRAHYDLVGLGVSAIGKVGAAYAQNCKRLPAYYAALEAGRFPIERGIALTSEDELRRAVIGSLMCSGRIDFEHVATSFGIVFADHFAPELSRLHAFAADGLIELDARDIALTPAGWLLARNVAAVFDAYLAPEAGVPLHAKAI